MAQDLIRSLLGEERVTLGDAILQAKAAMTHRDVQRTWMLFGDPTLRLPSFAMGTSPPAETPPDSLGGGGCVLILGAAVDPGRWGVFGLLGLYCVGRQLRRLSSLDRSRDDGKGTLQRQVARFRLAAFSGGD